MLRNLISVIYYTGETLLFAIQEVQVYRVYWVAVKELNSRPKLKL